MIDPSRVELKDIGIGALQSKRKLLKSIDWLNESKKQEALEQVAKDLRKLRREKKQLLKEISN